MRAPDLCSPIEGWRAWHVVEGSDGLRLHSTARREVWPPRRRLVATCRARSPLLPWRKRPAHEPPEETCSCGVHALRDLATALWALDVYGRPWKPLHRVIGRVAMWGEVIECSRGWRAGVAYPLEIIVPTRRLHGPHVPDVVRVAEELEAAYGTALHVIDGGTRAELWAALAPDRVAV